MDTERAIESVRINRVSVLSGLNLEKMKEFSFSRDKNKTACNNELSVLSGLNLEKM